MQRIAPEKAGKPASQYRVGWAMTVQDVDVEERLPQTASGIAVPFVAALVCQGSCHTFLYALFRHKQPVMLASLLQLLSGTMEPRKSFFLTDDSR